ncbi:MAG: hypothetical protein ACRDPA_20650, partial [Solirubrobacteraceae bacterium]
MRRAARRLAVMVVVAALWAGAGSALFASPAFAGGVYNNAFHASIVNLTPYTWTLVEQNSAGPPGSACPTYCWLTAPAQTIAPGQKMGYELNPNLNQCSAVDCSFGQALGFDGWMSYRVDVLGGPAEYVTIAVSQCQCSGVFGSSIPALRQFITPAPPPASFDPGPNPDAPPGPLTAGPQLVFQTGVPTAWDLTYSVAGNYTVDASTNLGASFVNVLNDACGSSPKFCTFTPTTPLTWGIGPPGSPQQATDCAAPGVEPNYFTIEYKAAQSASLSVGGGVTVSAEASLFGVIGAELSVSVEAEHEWEEVKTFTRETKVFIPPQDIASVWVVPVVGKITGTLVVTLVNPATLTVATFTATNFTETRSGVTKDPLTPAFNVITEARPMTAAELKDNCGQGSGMGLGAPAARPATRLVPGRGVPKVSL